MRKIELCDVTLRDGAQGEGIYFSKQDKLGIVTVLSRLGIGMIELGAPGMNERDREIFELLKNLKGSKLSAFGQTRRKEYTPETDPGLSALAGCSAKTVTIFGKSHAEQAEKVLKVTRKENLDMIYSSISFLRSRGKEVLFDAEHFFDGYKADPAYAMATLSAASKAGCSLLVLCDTRGGSFPDEVEEITGKVCAAFPALRVGIHCHNDMGLALACSLSAIKAGADHVQGSFTGFGERCGNTPLCQLIPTLSLKLGYRCMDPEELPRLTLAARYVSDIANLELDPSAPYVGSGAFAHKAGTHVDAMQKLEGAYEHISPESVGNERRFIASEQSGRATIYEKIRHAAPDIERNSPEVEKVLASVKALETNGWQFESADASLELLILRSLGRLSNYYNLAQFHVTDNYPFARDTTGCLASVKILVGDKEALESAEGDGPVHALDTALRKCLSGFYPSVSAVRLIDYKVRVITPNDATAARVRVLMNSTDGARIWTTVGTSRDIIRASWKALCDSVDYFLHRQEKI